MEKKFEELEIRDDFMFGVVMRNPKYCKPFLETILNIKIADISYPQSQETIDLSADAKGVRLDIYVEDGKGTVYDVEMQTTNKDNLPKRTRYYQGMLDLNILKKGCKYKNLNCSFIIFVCTFDLFNLGRHIYTFENRCIEEPGLALKDDAVKIILNTKGTADDVSPEMKRLLNFIDGHQPEDDYTRELEAAVESARKNEKWRVLDIQWMSVKHRPERSGEDYMTLQMHYQEKFEEGLEQGTIQEKTETAMRMIEDGDLSMEKIAQYSGLSLEQVRELSEQFQTV